MKQLTIEHLAPYLPYGLKCRSSWGTTFIMGIYNDMKGSGLETRTIDQCLDMNPCLRPLSQLTQEIEHNGQRFVPIVELLHVRFTRGALHILETVNEDHLHELHVSWDNRKSYTANFFFNSRTNSFHYVQHNRQQRVPYQHKMFKKLYEWHFDLEGLIDAGLALPIEN